MSTLENIGQSLKDTWEDLAEGWDQLWKKTRHALTRFTPAADDGDDRNGSAPGSRWGLLSAEVEERDDAISIRIEVPGIDPADLHLAVHNQALVVSGEKRYQHESNEGRMVIMETAYGRFQRTIPLPAPVADEQAEAHYRNGVLSVKLPRRHPGNRSQIAITP